MAEKPKVIMMFLKKFKGGIPSPSEITGAALENLLIAAKTIKARLQITVNFDKKESTFIRNKIDCLNNSIGQNNSKFPGILF